MGAVTCGDGPFSRGPKVGEGSCPRASVLTRAAALKRRVWGKNELS